MAAEQRPAGCFLRLFWMAIGTIALFLIGMGGVQADRPRLGLWRRYAIKVLLLAGAAWIVLRLLIAVRA
ncbi:MAG: hypothetical protein FJ295_06150 [Planctomycetes bacterium]|nr:hypothetical protein [Planctomycetota bacterium]